MDRGAIKERLDLTGDTTAIAVAGVPSKVPYIVVAGGVYVFDTVGSFTAAQLQTLKPDGTTWTTMDSHATGGGTSVVTLAVGAKVRLNLTGAVSGAFAVLGRAY